MKYYINLFFVLLLSFVAFTAVSYSNTFDFIFYNTTWKFVISFIWGMCLHKYFNKKSAFILSTIIWLGFTIFVLMPFDHTRTNYFLPNYSFAIIGYFWGYYFNTTNLTIKLLVLVYFIGFSFVNTKLIYPRYLSHEIEVKSSALSNNSLAKYLISTKLVDKNNNNYKGFDTGKIYLVDFFFKNCPPCKLKDIELTKIKQLNIPNFEIIYIDNGNIDNFKDFSEDSTNNEKIYDTEGLLSKNLGITGFPHELIIDKKGVIRYISDGFNPNYKKIYPKLTLEKINKLQNE